MVPAALQVPEAGLYSSADWRGPVLLVPPTTSTLPLFSSVAVCQPRARSMEPVALQVPEPGSYTSAAARWPLAFWPPETRTLPLGSNVAVWKRRGEAMAAAEDQPAAQ